MRRLRDRHEHLDGSLTDSAALDGNLRDLRRVNRRFGGARLSIAALRVVAAASGETMRRDPLRILDVGAGACDLPLAFAAARGPWRAIHVTAVDSRQEVLDAARRIEPGLDGRPELRLVHADGRSLPFEDEAFDVAHASLVLHHLEPDEAIAFLRELRRVSRLGVVVNDLQRGVLEWVGAWLVLHAMTRNRFTLHDGPLSVRRAYTRAEARGLLGEAGLRPIREVGALAGHRWAMAAIPAVVAVPAGR